MTLNKNNYFARYYNWVYGIYPQDVCSFFWGSVLAIMLSPFIVIGKPLIRKLDTTSQSEYSYFFQSFIGAIVYLFLVMFCGMGNRALEDWFGYEFIYWWSISIVACLFGLLIFVIVIIVGVGIGFLIHLGVKKATSDLNISLSPVIDNTRDFIGAIRGKYCTKITWK